MYQRNWSTLSTVRWRKIGNSVISTPPRCVPSCSASSGIPRRDEPKLRVPARSRSYRKAFFRSPNLRRQYPVPRAALVRPRIDLRSDGTLQNWQRRPCHEFAPPRMASERVTSD